MTARQLEKEIQALTRLYNSGHISAETHRKLYGRLIQPGTVLVKAGKG